MLLAVATPMLMIAPIIDSTLKVVCVKNSIHKMPANAPGNAVMMMNGISPRLEINDHQEINERCGEDEAEAQFAERAVHAFNLAAHVDRVPGWKFGAKLVYDFCDLIGDATEIRALHIGINVEYRLHIGVADVRWCFIALERDQIAQQLRMRRIVPRQRCRSNGIN
jgi:hypothetical protein